MVILRADRVGPIEDSGLAGKNQRHGHPDAMVVPHSRGSVLYVVSRRAWAGIQFVFGLTCGSGSCPPRNGSLHFLEISDQNSLSTSNPTSVRTLQPTRSAAGANPRLFPR